MNKHGSDEIVAPRLGVERRLGVIFLRRMPVVNIAAAFALLRAAISKRNKQPWRPTIYSEPSDGPFNSSDGEVYILLM